MAFGLLQTLLCGLQGASIQEVGCLLWVIFAEWGKEMPETLNTNSQVETELTDDLILRGEEQHRQGCKLYEQGRYPEAISSLNDALLQGESAERWNDWATVQLASSNYELAERGYRLALQLNPRPGRSAAAVRAGSRPRR